MRVTVVTLGDLGRSPRMQYHALALADGGADVDLVGSAGTEPLPTVTSSPRIACHRLRAVKSAAARRLPPLLLIMFEVGRATAQALQLAHALLLRVARPDVILVQSPPAVPALSVAWLAGRLRRTRVVIDWHNVGHAGLARQFGARHPITQLAVWSERAFGRRAHAHVCVSGAMRARLASLRIGDASVLYDRPAGSFVPLPPADREAFARTLVAQAGLQPGDVRPALVVCPTSWTADEDLELLLDAAGRCDLLLRATPATTGTGGPRVLVLITGMGPNREDFEARIAGRRMGAIALRTMWLTAPDYARALAAADLGLCLHRSPSALDLPMKLADMRGAGLPACVLDYGPVLAERFHDGGQGFIFRDAEALARLLRDLLAGSPELTDRLARVRAQLADEAEVRWDGGWALEARAAILGT